jgi:hypothetical protein
VGIGHRFAVASDPSRNMQKLSPGSRPWIPAPVPGPIRDSGMTGKRVFRLFTRLSNFGIEKRDGTFCQQGIEIMD